MKVLKDQERAPYKFESVEEDVAGFGVIRFCIFKDRSPAKLPWYKNSNAIPAEMRDAAEKVAREHSTTQSEFEWRMSNWQAKVTGYNHEVRCYYPWFMYSPTQALEYIARICQHEWVQLRSHTAHSNNVLGTYDAGYIRGCSKCGEEDYVRTHFNNYSGD
jgi:hypothetical protein